jgi:hypothetical protein
LRFLKKCVEGSESDEGYRGGQAHISELYVWLEWPACTDDVKVKLSRTKECRSRRKWLAWDFVWAGADRIFWVAFSILSSSNI